MSTSCMSYNMQDVDIYNESSPQNGYARWRHTFEINGATAGTYYVSDPSYEATVTQTHPFPFSPMLRMCSATRSGIWTTRQTGHLGVAPWPSLPIDCLLGIFLGWWARRPPPYVQSDLMMERLCRWCYRCAHRRRDSAQDRQKIRCVVWGRGVLPESRDHGRVRAISIGLSGGGRW